jgi:hypothetical protein
MTQTINDNLRVNGDVYLKGDNYVSLHYGHRGRLGQTPNFNPDNENIGLWLEASTNGFESGGLFCNGNTIVLWSPGDNDILRVYDEDDFGSPTLVPKFVIDNAGNVGIGTAKPKSLLQIGDGLSSGYRPWMIRGTQVAWDTDNVFLGLKDEGKDHKDSVIAWGDNADNDMFRFIFADARGGNFDKEIMRLQPNGNVIIGTTDRHTPGVLEVYRNPGDSLNTAAIGALAEGGAGETGVGISSLVLGDGDSINNPQRIGGYFYVGERGSSASHCYGIQGFAASANDRSYCYGIYGAAHGGSISYAGYFDGNVRVTGTVETGLGSFLIDHPLDPPNKTLRHSFIASPENLCLYRGKVKLDSKGEALVQMPAYFASLTKEDEATVNLTPIGKPFLVGYEWNQSHTGFMVYGTPDAEVSYIVLADRDDPAIRQLQRPVEEEKGNGNFEKGKLLYAEACGYESTLGVDYQAREQIKVRVTLQ